MEGDSTHDIPVIGAVTNRPSKTRILEAKTKSIAATTRSSLEGLADNPGLGVMPDTEVTQAVNLFVSAALRIFLFSPLQFHLHIGDYPILHD